MQLRPGDRVGAYEIVGLVGAGGMGEVYRARDVRLGRDVAIKVVAATLAGDPDRLTRFEQEARAAASLNHPNILAVHDVGQHDSSPFIVTELLEGMTLRERLAEAALPVRKAVDYAVQLARALAAAHDRGIVHRDLKPENVFITAGDRIKVLDFGLAKLTQPEPALAAGTAVPTTPPKTLPGVLLGTAGYMAPEQVRGIAADHRADIFALGVILYEMLAGRRAFSGDTPMDAMTAILREEPPAIPAARGVPPSLERIVARCLEKNPAARFQSADDLAFALESLSAHASGPTMPVERRYTSRRERLAWMVAAALLFLAVGLGITAYLVRRNALVRGPEMRLHVLTPPNSNPATFSVSPDGSKLVYAASGRLWLRELRMDTAVALPGTEGAGVSFWSPDGASIGFTAAGAVKRVDVATGLVRTLASGTQPIGGSWNADGVILFSPAPSAPLMRVDANGGGLSAVTRLDPPRQIAHRFPYFLSDGRHFLFFALGPLETRGVYVGSLDGAEPYRILDGDAPAVPLPPDSVLFMRDGALLTRRLNLSTRRLEGDEIAVSTQVAVAPMNFNGIAASVSASGLIAYRTAAGERDWFWFDRSGRQLGRVNAPDTAQPTTGRLSPDGASLTLVRTTAGNADVWLLDLGRGVPRRFTFEPVRERSAIWSPDGMRILFDSERTGVFDVYQRPVDRPGDEQLLLTSQYPKSVEDVTPDGRTLLFQVADPKTDRDLWLLPLGGGQPRPLVQTPFEDWSGRFSPDGRWIAYASDETGRDEVFVIPVDGNGPKRQVSTDGGHNPQWLRDGRELLYAAPNDRIMSVPIVGSPAGLDIGTPALLFRTPAGALDNVTFAADAQRFVVSPDGQRILLSIATAPPAPITLLFNWAQVRD